MALKLKKQEELLQHIPEDLLSAKHQLEILINEKDAIEHLKSHINENFEQACLQILSIKGKVIVMGIGKSGHIARKIAATLASTGTPAFFVHPGEASHGDLGMIDQNDIVLAISNSGEASEILYLFPLIKRLGITIISITSKPQSNMATLCDIHLNLGVSKEACPLGLAPTSSTTATLVLGDALAIALLEARGFTQTDFALSHPGGALGKKLLLRIIDIMHSGETLPIVSENVTVMDALLQMTAKGFGGQLE
jgi:arabinose-5-phosphate isomerase